MLCGFTPFEGQTSRELYKNIIAVNYSFPDPYWTKISSEAKDLIRRLLVPNPKDRLKVADVLAHPWIRTNHAEKLERAHPEPLAASRSPKNNAHKRAARSATPAPVAPSACAVADLKGPSPGPAMVKVAPSAP